jgi:hypothetical protein
MRAPTDTSEIISEIISEIRKQVPTASEAEISDIIKNQRLIKKNLQLSRGYREQNKKYAKAVSNWIEKGEGLLSKHHGTIDPALLFGQGFEGLFFITDENEKHLQQLKDTLGSMQQQCNLIVSSKFGIHRNEGLDQNRAAWAAAHLMLDHGLPLTYSSEISDYCTVASLLFEAMTGKESGNGSHIMKACRMVARHLVRLMKPK